ncbi:MAG: membrane protein insertion efficiency factor YidD [Candidatus Portnoybacteria bacterium CG10_big_fil_rev_8_21_14_0_10_38_18]|uniref:Putative membrane protein insertion efficiency factor n=1 Tax=Candidatus Portnoybacteria bacterium CG10_big_fil_rev_8_21_14_0_10_38_18 TaxID=1974813 RepID=A0A2M8KCI6_9BACT|nr:MAG: membrane protein insertion efficiency factor YidD [Candidatus Portnoybacteria bacterium CG10_big_fil_rev_8_21_14_0_10_38_18]
MKQAILKTIQLYQKFVSPALHSTNTGRGCRFYPTCSEYTYQAVRKYGSIKGLIMGFKRIIRCHPFNRGGYDPC